MADMGADAIIERVLVDAGRLLGYERFPLSLCMWTSEQTRSALPLIAALVALYEATGSYTWDEANEAYDTAMYRWEKAVEDARNAVTAIVEGSETP
jgi:hypothetical protein